jgi:TetR/AcrR family transcriptional regulator
MSSKQHILESAESVFAEVGYAGARIKDIAERAGVTTAMVHYYFESKDNLFKAVLNQILADLIVLSHSVAGVAPRAERIRTFFLGFFDYSAKHRNFARLTAMGIGSNREHFENLVREFFRPQFKDGVRFIQEGIEAKEFLPVDPEQLLTSIYGMTITYFAESHFISVLLGKDSMSGEMLAARRAALLDMIFKALGIECAAADRPAAQDAHTEGAGEIPPTAGADGQGKPPSQE